MSKLIDVLSHSMQKHKEVFRAQRLDVRKVLNTIALCRSGQLGASLKRCDGCGHEEFIAHSCRNRHCTRCQGYASYQWLESQEQKLLPVPYFHLVFTVPHSLNALFAQNQARCYDLLFKSASETLQEFGRNEWGARLGMTAVLHTWGQTMIEHYHLHCIVTGGGVSLGDNNHTWKHSPQGKHWLFPVKALSVVFRGKFMALVKDSVKNSQLSLQMEHLTAKSSALHSLFEAAYRKPWNVFAKRPFNGPVEVLRYLSLYTHRIAISDKRIEQLDLEGGRVQINYKDYKTDGKRRKMWLSLACFLARFCAHVLPRYFVKIRHYGILANRGITERIAKIREQLTLASQHALSQSIEALVQPKENQQEHAGPIDYVCPRCSHDGYTMVECARQLGAYIETHVPAGRLKSALNSP